MKSSRLFSLLPLKFRFGGMYRGYPPLSWLKGLTMQLNESLRCTNNRRTCRTSGKMASSHYPASPKMTASEMPVALLIHQPRLAFERRSTALSAYWHREQAFFGAARKELGLTHIDGIDGPGQLAYARRRSGLWFSTSSTSPVEGDYLPGWNEHRDRRFFVYLWRRRNRIRRHSRLPAESRGVI